MIAFLFLLFLLFILVGGFVLSKIILWFLLIWAAVALWRIITQRNG
jgi:hypothetical protein